MKVNYNWLKDYVGEAMPETAEVDALLTAHAFEIEGVEQVGEHTVIDVDVLPNRSSDCLCHRGIAREIATILGVGLHYDPLAAPPSLDTTDKIQVNIADTAACPRFTASLITGIKVKESPGWLKERLESLGQRSINNIVDATNYVMYAIGQPLHAYDADLFPQVDGKWQFGVRFGEEGETVSLLAEGGKDEERIVECKGTELLIVDESSNTPIGLAGVKGGQFAGVHAGSTNIIIEAAHFDPTVTRKTARRLGIVIDASKRFENECSRELPPFGQYEIIKLIKDIAGGECVGTIDQYHETKPNPAVKVNPERANALLGLALTKEEMVAYCLLLGASLEADSLDKNGTFTAVGPFERTDLNIEVDFIEEIGRLHGLDNITSVAPDTSSAAVVNKRQYYSEAVRQTLLKVGLSEVVTSSFQKKDKIQLQNALASDKSYVRSGLSKNMNAALDANYAHGDLLGMPIIKIFEIGTVFEAGEENVGEHMSLCVGVRSKGSGYTPKDDATLQAALAAVAETLGKDIDWNIEKGVAEVNFDETIESLETPSAYEPFVKSEDKTYRPVSPYPAVARDIALWVQSEITTEQVAETIKTEASELCVRLDLFDEFEKEGRTSYAFRLVFQSHAKTLTDSEVNTIMDRVNQAASELGWEVR